MSNDKPETWDEARKHGGWKLYGPDGMPAIVPNKVMRCPSCNGEVIPKTGLRHKDRTGPDGMQIFKCKGCHIEFQQLSKKHYCNRFLKHITSRDCQTCPVGRPHILVWRERIYRGEIVDPDETPCPHLQKRVGLDWTPEQWDRDIRAGL